MAAMERFNALEGARGVLAVLVMLAHFEANYHGKSLLLAESVYYIVDFFFVFSGFLMARIYWDGLKTPQDLKEYAIVRFGRIYPLHFLWLMIFIVFESFRLTLPEQWLDSKPFTGTNDVTSVPAQLLLLQAMGFDDKNSWNFSSWSLSTEFYAYFLFAALLFFFKRTRIPVAILLVLASILVLATQSDIGFRETYYLGFFRCVAGFMFGVLIFPIYKHTQILRNQKIKMTVMEFFAIVVFICFSQVSIRPEMSLATPLIAGLLVYVLSFDAGHISALLSRSLPIYLGTISYSLYLAHAFVQNRMLNFFKLLETKGFGSFFYTPEVNNLSSTAERFLGSASKWHGDLYALLMVCLTVLVSHYTYRWVEETGREWSKQRIKSLRSRQRGL